jgi:hypothetical protein
MTNFHSHGTSQVRRQHQIDYSLAKYSIINGTVGEHGGSQDVKLWFQQFCKSHMQGSIFLYRLVVVLQGPWIGITHKLAIRNSRVIHVMHESGK